MLTGLGTELALHQHSWTNHRTLRNFPLVLTRIFKAREMVFLGEMCVERTTGWVGGGLSPDLPQQGLEATRDPGSRAHSRLTSAWLHARVTPYTGRAHFIFQNVM